MIHIGEFLDLYGMEGMVKLKQLSYTNCEVSFREFETIGELIEKLLSEIKEKEYGIYSISDMEYEKKIALKIIEGMINSQRELNKGIRFDNFLKMEAVEIYNINLDIKNKLDKVEYIDWL